MDNQNIMFNGYFCSTRKKKKKNTQKKPPIVNYIATT